MERLHHFLLLYLLPCAFLDDNSSCGGRETRDLDIRHQYTRETQEVLAKTWKMVRNGLCVRFAQTIGSARRAVRSCQNCAERYFVVH